MSWDFETIMIMIVGVPTNDVESTIIYVISSLLGTALILLVFSLFGIAGKLLTPR
jgi:uncharacterized phage infection (PIP) family protein YhgE